EAKMRVSDIDDELRKAKDASLTKMILVLAEPITKQCRKRAEQEDGIEFEFFRDDDLVVNITKHVLVPKHELLTEEQKAEVLAEYKCSLDQLPRIMVTDPIARYLGLKPNDVVRITRKSETAGRYITYRACFK
ncbi:archaeal RpoH /eukaryotic RPB5 RNA polymerase subunit, partial [Kipferlia bialata]